MLRVVAHREQPAVHHRMQRLDPAVEHLRERRSAPLTSRTGRPAVAQRRRGAAGGDELDAARRRAPPRGRRGRSCRRPRSARAGSARDRRSWALPRAVSGQVASAMRPIDQVTWPRYSTTSARTTTCIVGSGAGGGRRRSRPSPRGRPSRRRRGTARPRPSRQRQQHHLPLGVELGAARPGAGGSARRSRAGRGARAPLELVAAAGVGDGQDVLAAQLPPARVDEEPALVQQPVARDVAVLGGEQPLAAGVLRLPHRDVRRPVDQPRPEGARGEPGRDRSAPTSAPSTSTVECAAVCARRERPVAAEGRGPARR